MRDTDYTVEGEVSAATPSKACSVCGKPLSKYNRLGHCFHHPDSNKERLRLAHEARLQALEIARALPIVRKIHETPVTMMPPQEKADVLTADIVVDLVCRLFRVNEMAIIAAGRQVDVSRARQIIMYLLRTDLFLSYPVIGGFLGGRDHTTIMHGVSKISEELEKGSELQQTLTYVRSKYPPPSAEK